MSVRSPIGSLLLLAALVSLGADTGFALDDGSFSSSGYGSASSSSSSDASSSDGGESSSSSSLDGDCSSDSSSSSSSSSSSEYAASYGYDGSSSSWSGADAGCFEKEVAQPNEAEIGPFVGTETRYVLVESCNGLEREIRPLRESLSATANQVVDGQRFRGSLSRQLYFAPDGSITKATGGGFLIIETNRSSRSVEDGGFKMEPPPTFEQILLLGGDGRGTDVSKEEGLEINLYKVTADGSLVVSGGSFVSKRSVSQFKPNFDGYKWTNSVENLWGKVLPDREWQIEKSYSRTSGQEEILGVSGDRPASFKRTDRQQLQRFEGGRALFARDSESYRFKNTDYETSWQDDTETSTEWWFGGQVPVAGVTRTNRVRSEDTPIGMGRRNLTMKIRSETIEGRGTTHFEIFERNMRDESGLATILNYSSSNEDNLGRDIWEGSHSIRLPADAESERRSCSTRMERQGRLAFSFEYDFDSVTGTASYGNPTQTCSAAGQIPAELAEEMTACDRWAEEATTQADQIFVAPFDLAAYE